MNENIDLTKILKDCPKGFKLYSPIPGYITFVDIILNNFKHPIIVKDKKEREFTFSKNGKYFDDYDGECCLFPSKDQRDWSKFTAPWYKKERFNPKTLKPFDKVLVRDSILVDGSPSNLWKCQIFSFIREDEDYPYVCINDEYSFCIPYNDDTKHLVGTNKEAPEFYKYWEE